MSRHFGRPLAILLCALLASPAVSLSAAERAAVLGRIVAAPPAQVNGVALPADATLLDGDRLATGAQGWARVLLARGEQIHLAALSDARALRQQVLSRQRHGCVLQHRLERIGRQRHT